MYTPTSVLREATYNPESSMYKNLSLSEFNIHQDSVHEKRLRDLASVPDMHRPANERFLELLYASLSDDKAPSSRLLPHSDIFYCRAALEAKFPDRQFTIKEVEQLIDEIYGESM